MKYIVDGEKEFETASEVAEYITDNMDDSYYDEMLDECGDAQIGGISYTQSIAFARVDPIAYRCGKNDYYDSLSGDIKYEIDRMYGGGEEDFYGFKVECVDDEEEEEEEEES